jgi:hypothetical protein
MDQCKLFIMAGWGFLMTQEEPARQSSKLSNFNKIDEKCSSLTHEKKTVAAVKVH